MQEVHVTTVTITAVTTTTTTDGMSGKPTEERIHTTIQQCALQATQFKDCTSCVL